MRADKRLIWGLGLLLIIGVAACSDGGINSPTSPSANGAAGATITGTVQMASAGPSAGRLAAHTSTSVDVCVVLPVIEPQICDEIDEEGKFTLRDPRIFGDVTLELATVAGRLMEIKLFGVLAEEHITISAELSDGTWRIESRVGGDDVDDAESMDDESVDDAESMDDDGSGESGPG